MILTQIKLFLSSFVSVWGSYYIYSAFKKKVRGAGILLILSFLNLLVLSLWVREGKLHAMDIEVYLKLLLILSPFYLMSLHKSKYE